MGEFKLSDSERYAKSLVRLAIHKTGSNRMASEWTGIQESELSRYGSEDVDRHIPFYRAIELDEAAGDVMLKALARRRGYDLVSKEQREELTLNVNKLVGKLAHAGADLTSTAIEATEDGRVSHNELKQTEAAAGAVVDTAERVVSAVAQLRAVS